MRNTRKLLAAIIFLVGCGSAVSDDTYPPLMPGGDTKSDVANWLEELRPGRTVSGQTRWSLNSHPITLRRGDEIKLNIDASGLRVKLSGEGAELISGDIWRVTRTRVYEVSVINEAAEKRDYKLGVECLAGPCQDDPQWRQWEDDYEDNNVRDKAAVPRLGHLSLLEGFGHARWELVFT